MTKRTKLMMAWCLLGLATVTGLNALGIARLGTYSAHGSGAVGTMTIFAACAYLFFNYFLIRILTGIRIFGWLSNKEDRKPVRQFSWVLLLASPLYLAGPVWLFLTQGALMHYAVAGSALALDVCFFLLYPPADGDLAMKKFKAEMAAKK